MTTVSISDVLKAAQLHFTQEDEMLVISSNGTRVTKDSVCKLLPNIPASNVHDHRTFVVIDTLFSAVDSKRNFVHFFAHVAHFKHSAVLTANTLSARAQEFCKHEHTAPEGYGHVYYDGQDVCDTRDTFTRCTDCFARLD